MCDERYRGLLSTRKKERYIGVLLDVNLNKFKKLLPKQIFKNGWRKRVFKCNLSMVLIKN